MNAKSVLLDREIALPTNEIGPPSSTSTGRGRRWWIVAALAVIVLSFIALLEVRKQRATQDLDAAYKAALNPTSSVVALGSVVPGNAVIHLNAPASSGEARLQSLAVRQNDSVSKNEILGALDSIGRLKAAVLVARADVTQKRAALEKVIAGNSSFQIAAQQATVERLRAEAIRQKSDVQRYRALHIDGIISDSEWDSRSVAFNQANAALQEAESTFKQAAEVRPVDVDVAKSDLLSAEASLGSAEANVEQAYIRAPADGQILHIYTWPGERISDSGVLDLASLKEIFIEAEVYETDISRLHQDQTATITGSALAVPLHGKIAVIEKSIGRQQIVNTDPAANTDARVVIVRIRLDPESRVAAEHLINLQVRVEFDPR